MIILGLDMSSTCIGYATADGVCDSATLVGDIAARCAQAEALVVQLLDTIQPALVVIESPVARFAKAVIPQARVSGAVLAELSRRAALWTEVAPGVAKKVLTGDGAATKQEMVRAAAVRLNIGGASITIGVVRGKVCAVRAGAVVLTEDEADAYALALAGRGMRVVTKGAA